MGHIINLFKKNCKNSIIVKYYNLGQLISNLIYLKMQFIPDGKADGITPVLSVTSSFWWILIWDLRNNDLLWNYEWFNELKELKAFIFKTVFL